ncbi:MAG: hypothetical protein DRP85_00785 [Candidatus Makaraimicrobium thalassicum]|nr:MAG: hypothetical protein DRP85_00785 [Candidatus Omnitrophota bacterium]
MIGIGFTSNIRYNLKQYCEKLFLDNGFYTNVTRNIDFYDETSLANLRRVEGIYYESIANEWVYETDISAPSGFPSPILPVSGVWINGSFHANNSHPYYPSPDYLRGRYIFRNPPPQDATVEAEYSYKDVKVDFVDSHTFNILMSRFLTNAPYSSSESIIYPSGLERILPVVIIEPTTRNHFPRQIGGGKIIKEYISFFVFAARDYERDAIIDVIFGQAREVIKAVDYNSVPEIMTFEGDYSSTYKNYTQLQSDHFWTNIYIDELVIRERDLLNNIYRGRIDAQLSVYLRD